MITKIEDIVTGLNKVARLTIDEVKNSLTSITLFFDYIKNPLITTVRDLREIDTPSSSFYNKFLTSIENDCNVVYNVQETVRKNLLASWNVIETSYPEEVKPFNPYDNDITLEHEDASVFGDRLSLGVKGFTSAAPNIKDKPLLSARSTDSSIPVFYGKSWGVWSIGNESGEDGIRYENNDGSLITDEKDTFWEVEATVLQADREETIHFQSVSDKDIALYTTIKIIFDKPMNVNMFTINPYNAAVSAYYKIIKMEVSDGIRVVPIDVKETFVMGETTITFDTPEILTDKKIRSIFVTLKQETGYYLKYSLGYYRIKNNESWLDITGPHVTQMAKARGENFNSNVTYIVENANQWILNNWMPGISFDELPVLDTDMGIDGYRVVASTESKRKRYTIGITDIKVGLNEYHDTSEKVTKQITIPDGYNTVSIKSIDQGNVVYFISFDDGMTWNKINPLDKQPVRESDLKLVPNKLYINSDLALYRKQNTDTGEAAFINTISKNIRIRFVMSRTENSDILPAVFSWEPVFGVN